MAVVTNTSRLSRNMVLLLLAVSLVINMVQFLHGAVTKDGMDPSTSAFYGNQQLQKESPQCPPCKCDCADNNNQRNLQSADSGEAKGAAGADAAEKDGALPIAVGNSAPSSYTKHGLVSEYDYSSPVHTIVDVSGIGPMIAVATPIWRLVPKNSRGVVDDAPVPGQVVGSEKLKEEEENRNDKNAKVDFNKPDIEVEKDDEVNGKDSGRKLLFARPPSSDSNIPPANTLQLWIAKDITRISIDVGTFLTSPSSKRWWYWDPKAMVVAFEPNIVSGMLLTRISHPAFNTQLGGYWPTCPIPTVNAAGEFSNVGADGKPILNRQIQLDNMADCLNASYGHITRHMDRFVLFPVALSNKDYYANFQYGFPGRADSGSLLAFNRQMIKKRQGAKPLFALPTPVMKMASILSFLPTHRVTDGTPILWDTLKIDAQGVDSLIIEGAGHLLKRFACILGEFDYSSYKGVRKFDYRAYLVYELGFIMTKKTTFINPSLADVVYSQQALCFSSDVAVEYGKLARVIAKMKSEGTYPKQREHPELLPIKRG